MLCDDSLFTQHILHPFCMCVSIPSQLENATKAPDESPTDQEEGGKDHKDDAIEMDFDFEGQVEDIEQDNEEDPGKDEEAGPEEELTEKMGDLGNDLGEELDKNIWDPEEEDKVSLHIPRVVLLFDCHLGVACCNTVVTMATSTI